MSLYGEVIETERLSPTMVRVVLGGDGLDSYEPAPFADQYVNALFIPDGAPYSVPFDAEAAFDGPAEHRPRGRRYTIRSWDPDTRRVTIDFVVHGDVGHAGRWASSARPGDRLQIVGPHGAYRPDPDADWYLMVGDESAVPAIAAALEQLSADDEARVVVVVDGPDCELPLESSARLDVRWVHRTYEDGDVDRVVAALGTDSVPDGRPDVFVHGEAGEVRAVRKALIAELGIDREASSISPYWRRGETDEAWREHKRAWVAEMLADI